LIDEADGSETIAASSGSINAVDVGTYDVLRYDRIYTAPSDEGRYRAIWSLGCREAYEVVVVATESTAAFATTDDVAARLGRELTTGEQASVEFLLAIASSVIADTAGRDDGWVVTLDPVPTILRGLSVELVVRALANPNQLASLREQLGNYSMAATFASERTGMTLTPTEVLIVRRAVYGRTTGSAPVGRHHRGGMLRLAC
jgi:hypothetical protein